MLFSLLLLNISAVNSKEANHHSCALHTKIYIFNLLTDRFILLFSKRMLNTRKKLKESFSCYSNAFNLSSMLHVVSSSINQLR